MRDGLRDALKLVREQFQRDNLLQADGVMMPRGQTERRIHRDNEVAWTYRRTICGGPHAGVFSPKICHKCWDKGLR